MLRPKLLHDLWKIDHDKATAGLQTKVNAYFDHLTTKYSADSIAISSHLQSLTTAQPRESNADMLTADAHSGRAFVIDVLRLTNGMIPTYETYYEFDSESSEDFYA